MAESHKSSMRDNVILLVEDCKEDASLVLHSFKKWGITNPVKVVTDGEDAIAYLGGTGEFSDRAAHPLPVIALLDINMPRISGLEVLEWMQSHSELANVPTVVLSGTKDPDAFSNAQRLGAIACVAKSLDLAQLYELIQHLNYFSVASDYNNSAVDWTTEP